MIGNAQPVLTPAEKWKKKYPSILTGIFSFIQCVITLVIIGCEVGSVLIDAIVATVYVGFWAGLFFMIAWITLASSSCCCRNCGCATYTLFMQLISVFFSICVIGFDSYYIANPSTCFYPSSTCKSNGTSRGLFYSSSNFNNIKMPLIKAQLAAGCVMYILSFAYLVIYFITIYRVRRTKQSPTIHPMQTPPGASNGTLTASPMNGYVQPYPVVNNGNRVSVIACPTCNGTLNMTANKWSPM